MPTGDSKDPDVTLSLATVPDFDDLTDNEDDIDEYSTALDVEAQLLCSLLALQPRSTPEAFERVTNGTVGVARR